MASPAESEGGSRMARLKSVLARGNAERKAASGQYDENTPLVPGSEITLGSLMVSENLSFQEAVLVMQQFRAERVDEPPAEPHPKSGGTLPESGPASSAGKGKKDGSGSAPARPGALKIASVGLPKPSEESKVPEAKPSKTSKEQEQEQGAEADEATPASKKQRKAKTATAAAMPDDEDNSSEKKKKKRKDSAVDDVPVEETSNKKKKKKKKVEDFEEAGEPTASAASEPANPKPKSKRKVDAPEEESPSPEEKAREKASKKAKKAKNKENAVQLRRLTAQECLEEEAQDEGEEQEPEENPSKPSKPNINRDEIQAMIDEIDRQIEDEEQHPSTTNRRRHSKKRPPTPEASPAKELQDEDEAAPHDGAGDDASGWEWTEDEWAEWCKFKGWDANGVDGQTPRVGDDWDTWSQDGQPDFTHGWKLN